MRRCDTKSKFEPLNRFLAHDEEKLSTPPRLTYHSIMRRVMSRAANSEVRIPMMSVVANPLISPVPNKNRMIPVRNVVTLESRMDDSAF